MDIHAICYVKGTCTLGFVVVQGVQQNSGSQLMRRGLARCRAAGMPGYRCFSLKYFSISGPAESNKVSTSSSTKLVLSSKACNC